MQELEGKRAVITGSTQRLGLAVARRFASDGCDIVLHGLGDVEAIAALQRQIETDCSVRTLETTAYDITCNAVCPGTSATPIQEATLTSLQQAQHLERDAAERLLLTGKQPTGRLIAPDSVAGLIASLCMPRSRDITGAAIPIDGGWSAI